MAGLENVDPAPAMTEGPRSDIFTSTTNDDFFDVGGDDDLPSFLR